MKLVKNIALALASALIVLILFELGLRAYLGFFGYKHDQFYERSPWSDLPYVARANFHKGNYSTNSYHLRYRDIPLEKPPHNNRIAVVGNSVTIAHNVTQDELFTTIMERDLNRGLQGGSTVNVINAGQEGYDMAYFLPFTRHLVYPYQPDLIIYQYCLNDVCKTSTAAAVRNPNMPGKSRASNWLLKHLAITGMTKRLGNLRSFAERTLSNYSDSALVTSFYDDLAAWAEDARSRNIRFVVALFPSSLEVQAPDKYPDLTARIRQIRGNIQTVCQERNIEVYDLLEPIRAEYLRLDKNLYGDFVHMRAAGHEVTAKVLEQLPIYTDPTSLQK
jgi:lysophospholipase L1-like esterase